MRVGKMREAKVLMAMLAAGALALGAGISLAATGETKTPEASNTPAVSNTPTTSGTHEGKEMKAVRGQVMAVDPSAKTLSVKPTHGKEAKEIGVEVPDTVKIMQGKATKTLAEVKVGDRIYLQYDQMGNKLVADQIHILRPGNSASKSIGKSKSS